MVLFGVADRFVVLRTGAFDAVFFVAFFPKVFFPTVFFPTAFWTTAFFEGVRFTNVFLAGRVVSAFFVALLLLVGVLLRLWDAFDTGAGLVVVPRFDGLGVAVARRSA